ncbi:MAG: UDP-N-acetylmuramate--L-alanine ligase [Candidatus Omnitrophota bacterium]
MDKHIHFIGIGGIGMSGIAQLFLSRGVKVSGSDIKKSKITEELKKQGARIFIGHCPENIKGADLVVYSSAIKEDNPEFVQAKTKGVALIKRAQALADLMQNKIVITVAGSHGKTTTTSLVSCLLSEAGLRPTAAIGGVLKNMDTNAYSGSGDFFVAEADESDGSFLCYNPDYSIITNVDHEHLDYYKEFKNIEAAFSEFLGRTKKDGCVFCCNDDANLKNILKDYKNRYLLFGLSEGADIYAKKIEFDGLASEFDCFYNNKFIDRFLLNLGGVHNVSNALSVIALGLELNIEAKVIKRALRDYKGAQRRLEIKFRNNDYSVVDDYAHHPTEIKATLAALKNLKPVRLIAVFQPHRYSRTKLLLEEFAASFVLADYIIVTDIYAASEPRLEGVDGLSLYNAIRKHVKGKDIYFLPKQEITAHILKIIEPQDMVVTLGAGDIVKVSDELAEELKKKS